MRPKLLDVDTKVFPYNGRTLERDMILILLCGGAYSVNAWSMRREKGRRRVTGADDHDMSHMSRLMQI